jgi:hypothetical protein
MDVPDRLRALAPERDAHLSDAEWIALKAHLQAAAKHDAMHNGGFTEQYQPFMLSLDYVLAIYEAGRDHRLPQDWIQALHQLRVMKTPDYRKYLELQQSYVAVAEIFTPYQDMCAMPTRGRGQVPLQAAEPPPKKYKPNGMLAKMQ